MEKEIPNRKTRNNEEVIHFRRNEDRLRYEIIVKMISLLKWSIILVIAILVFFYRIISNQNQMDQYQIQLLNETIEKINNLNLSRGTSSNNQIVPDTCVACHPEGTNLELKLRANFSYTDFKSYIRGERRLPENTVMPKFREDEITDKQIEKIYNYLKYIK